MHMQSSVKLDLEEELNSSSGKKVEEQEGQPPQENFSQPLLNKATPEYLQELLKDKKQLQSYNNVFKHVEIILEKEITRVRERLFHMNGSSKKGEEELPDPSGNIVVKQEKVFVPVKENPTYNFVGRLLGPRGLTAKQLEQDLECKIMVRGQGSMRDKRKEDQNRGKPNWEHLDEELHVLVSVEDYENRADLKLRRAVETIKAFLEQGVKTPENEDRLKQLQLMELAVLNDKDRQQATIQQQAQFQQQLLLQQQAAVAAQQIQSTLNPTASSPVSMAGMTAQQQIALLQNPSAFLGRYNANPSISTIASSHSPNSMIMASLQSQFGANPGYALQANSAESLQAAAALLCGGNPGTGGGTPGLMLPTNSPSNATMTSQSNAAAVPTSAHQSQNQQQQAQNGQGSDILSMANAAASFSLNPTISAQAQLNTDLGFDGVGNSLKMRSQPQQAHAMRMHPYLR